MVCEDAESIDGVDKILNEKSCLIESVVLIRSFRDDCPALAVASEESDRDMTVIVTLHRELQLPAGNVNLVCIGHIFSFMRVYAISQNDFDVHKFYYLMYNSKSRLTSSLRDNHHNFSSSDRGIVCLYPSSK